MLEDLRTSIPPPPPPPPPTATTAETLPSPIRLQIDNINEQLCRKTEELSITQKQVSDLQKVLEMEREAINNLSHVNLQLNDEIVQRHV